MKRPRFWLRYFFGFILALVFLQYLVLTWFIPHYLMQLLHLRLGDQVSIDRIEISPSMVMRLKGIHVAGPEPGVNFSIQSVLIRPRWVWYAAQILELDSIKIEQPFLQLKRTAQGKLITPHLGKPGPSQKAESNRLTDWEITVGSITLSDGAVEYFDESAARSFHFLFDHLSASVGPASFPLSQDRSSFAIRGAGISQEGDSASFYCSGWAGILARDLQFSCQSDPLPLVSFEPYFQRSPVIRAYSVTVRTASQWTAKANSLDARIQFELGNLVEGDLSVRGRTLIDVKKLAASGQKSLSAELALHGPLDDPQQWEGDLTPGNPPVQKLVEELLERKIRLLRVSMAGHSLGVRLASATPSSMEDIKAASKEISEALEILSAPLVYQMPPDTRVPFTAERLPVIVMPSAEFVPEPVKPQETQPAALPDQPAPPARQLSEPGRAAPIKVEPEPAAPVADQLPPSQ